NDHPDHTRPRTQGQRSCRLRSAYAQARRLDLAQGEERTRRRYLLEDLQRARGHAALEASPGQGSLGVGELHPQSPKVVVAPGSSIRRLFGRIVASRQGVVVRCDSPPSTSAPTRSACSSPTLLQLAAGRPSCRISASPDSAKASERVVVSPRRR